jgi:hypothetical protein
VIRGENDVNLDAQFIDPEADDYHLDPDLSPAVDAGNASGDGALYSELFDRTTAPGGAPDEAPLDLGYHYPAPPEETPSLVAGDS